MISVCIPIYNFDVTNLVEELCLQLKKINVPSEIVLIDDSSDTVFKEKNEAVCIQHNYTKLEKNIGRAAIRNLFLKYAKFDHLLFLDCDSKIAKDDFLATYIKTIKNNPNHILCGGRVYKKTPPTRNKRLRWKYGRIRESKPSNVRNKNPYKSFMTHNFVIKKSILKTVGFDERLTSYGHEDTLFGFHLKKKNVQVMHIHNPILNGDLETNSSYVLSAEKANDNLIKILGFLEYDKEFIKDVSLLKIYFKAVKFKGLIRLVFKVLKPLLKKMLVLGFVNLYLFDFYKLGILTLKINNKEYKHNYN